MSAIDEIFSKCKTYEDICNAMFELNEMLDLSTEENN